MCIRDRPDAALCGMRLLTGGVPAVALVLAFLLLGGYTLHGSRAAAVRAQAAALAAGEPAGLGGGRGAGRRGREDGRGGKG